MNIASISFRFVRFASLAAALALASVAASAQEGAAAPQPDGSKAASILGLQIDHASISVADINAETKWYIEKLGFTLPAPAQKMGKMMAEHLKMPGFMLDLIQYEGSGRPPAPNPVFMQQGYIHLVFSVADTTAAYNFLKASGVDLPAPRNPGKIGNFTMHDPEGNEIEITGR